MVVTLLVILLASAPTSATLAGLAVAMHMVSSLLLAASTLQQPARSFWFRFCAHRVPASWMEHACCANCPHVVRRGWFRAVESATRSGKSRSRRSCGARPRTRTSRRRPTRRPTRDACTQMRLHK